MTQPKEEQMPDPKPTKCKRRVTPDSNPETIGELFDIMVAASEDEDGGGELEGRFSRWLEAIPELRKEYEALKAAAEKGRVYFSNGTMIVAEEYPDVTLQVSDKGSWEK